MKSTKIFLDTEFTGLHQQTTLSSIGLVADSGEEFYAEFTDYDKAQVTEWIHENVISKLEGGLPSVNEIEISSLVKVSGSRNEIAGLLKEWFTRFGVVEIWADVLAYDWVLFCELFGGTSNIPENIFYAPFDLATIARSKGVIEPKGKYEGDFSRFDYSGADRNKQHHALVDAKVEMECWNKIMITQ